MIILLVPRSFDRERTRRLAILLAASFAYALASRLIMG